MGKIQRVLLVDDDSCVRGLAELSLSSVGNLDVCSCESGQQALDQIVEFDPDIILLDSNMPEMSGPETLAAIRAMESFQSIPIIFVTGETRAEEIAHLKSLGAIEVITKPYDPMTLSQQVITIGESLNV